MPQRGATPPRRAPRPSAPPFLVTTARGRRSPALAWPVRTAAGETFALSGLQRAALHWITGQVARGRHRWRIRDLAAAIGTGPGNASKIHRRLRSLSLIGGPHPVRGRHGHALTWLPSTASARRDRADRAVRWPTCGNDSTLTAYGGFVSREGLGRAFRAAAESANGPPAAIVASPRARGRAWPPRTVYERCPRGGGGRRVRLRLAWQLATTDDLAIVWAARCPACRRGHAASAVFARPRSSGPVRLDGSAPGPVPVVTPARRSLAMAFAAADPRISDELLVRYLGYRRQALPELQLRPVHDGDDLDALLEAARHDALVDLAALGDARLLRPPRSEDPP